MVSAEAQGTCAEGLSLGLLPVALVKSRNLVLCMDPGSSLVCSEAAVYSLYPKSDEPIPLPYSSA